MRRNYKFLLLCLILSLSVLLPISAKAEPTDQTLGWVYENGNYKYYYLKNNTPTVLTTSKGYVIEFSSDTSCTTESGTTVFKAGKYYFTSEGVLDLTAKSAPDSLPVYKPGDNYTLPPKKTNTSTGNATWYMVDVKAASKATSGTQITYTPNTLYYTGLVGNKVYKTGSLYKNGYVMVNNVLYTTDDNGTYSSSSSYTGVLNSAYVDSTLKTVVAANKKCYKSGKLYTGFYKNTYYKNGVKQTTTGWMKISKKIYYLKNGVAVTGSQYLKSYGGGSKKYHYTFTSAGVLKTDLLTSNVSKWKSKKLKVEVNVSTHTVTVLAYSSSTKSYDIPLKAFVCSTAKKASNQKYGTFNINRNGTKRWFAPAIAKGKRIYQWASQIYGSGALFHSQVYTARNNRTLVASYYNGLGTNQTTYCIRVQAINAKILHDISNAHKGTTSARIPVQIYKSSTNKGAFGQVKLSDTTGKIPTSQKYDPTDPTIK